MALEWMGKYRAYVEAMVRYGNAYAQAINVNGIFTDPPINSTQLQVLEYIYENEERNDNMSMISDRLQISLSAFSKNVKQLEALGLLEKYHRCGNNKDVIIKITDRAKKLYDEYSTGPRTEVWRKSFELLDSMRPEEIDGIVRMLDLHSEYLGRGVGRSDGSRSDKLIKIKK